MTMPGPKPQPSVVRALHGDPRQRGRRVAAARHAVEPPLPGPGDLSAPADLTEQQREVWADVVTDAPPNVLCRADIWVLRSFVVAADLHRTASAALAQTGALVPAGKAETTQHVQSPWVAIQNRQALLVMRSAELLGLAPAARPRLVGTARGASPIPSAVSEQWAKKGPVRQGETVSLAEFLARAPRR